MKLHNGGWVLLAALFLGVAGLAQADTLTGVLPTTPGGTNYQAYYDSTTNLTWLANANVNGAMTWSAANTWANGYSVTGYNSAGQNVTVTGWTLPTTTQPDPTCSDQITVSGFPTQGYGFSCTGSEMGNLFYNVLGGTAGNPLSSTDPFTNVQFGLYWSATEYAPGTNGAWYFGFSNGSQSGDGKDNSLYGWAVHAGE